MNSKPQLIDVNKLAEIPAIKDAIEQANIENEAQAAAVRKAVIDQVIEAEAALAALEEVDNGLVAQIVVLEEQLGALREKQTQHSYKLQQQNRVLRDLEKVLYRDHGDNLIKLGSRMLRSLASNFRTEAAFLRSLSIQVSRMGNTYYVPDEDARARADIAEKKALAAEDAAQTIEDLQLEPISPQEVIRRISHAGAPYGLKIEEGIAQDGRLGIVLVAEGPATP